MSSFHFLLIRYYYFIKTEPNTVSLYWVSLLYYIYSQWDMKEKKNVRDRKHRKGQEVHFSYEGILWQTWLSFIKYQFPTSFQLSNKSPPDLLCSGPIFTAHIGQGFMAGIIQSLDNVYEYNLPLYLTWIWYKSINYFIAK